MNRSYTLVWNHCLGAWSVTSELARRRGKGAGAVLAMALLLPSVALAANLPSGGQVVSGAGSINTPSSQQMVIQQGSPKLAIDWQSFDIAAGHKVTFDQPNSNAVALNRVLGSDGSSIMGQLDANGRVFVVNPNGVVFGKGAEVNVGGLVASTLDLSVSDFEAGNYQFKGDGTNARVINHGTLNAADGGAIALLGGTVSNQGVIVAQKGTVALAAGNQVTLDFAGDGLLNVQVDEAVVDALAENHQLIKADGGQVLLTAHAGAALLSTVVNNTGVIEAQTLGNKDGKIVLLGSFDGGTVQVAGTLDASAPNGGNGGFIDTSGAYVNIADSTKVTTQAAQGKTGTWLIDPTDFTVSAGGAAKTGSGIGADTLSHNLATSNVILQTVDTGSEAGDIHVNAQVNWSANTLTLNAHQDINLNANLNASGTAKLALEYGQGAVAAGNSADYHLNNGAQINLPAGQNFSTKLGHDGATQAYTVITQLGAAGSTIGTDLQGISGNLNGHYVLGADIDASATAGWNNGLGFNPIGNNGSRFTGSLDGLGHSISGLTINRVGQDYAGLFGSTDGSATLRNIGLVGGSVIGRNRVGGLVGYNRNGTILQAYATGAVTGDNQVGGLVGNNYGSISQAYATVAVSGTTNVGGLVGNNYGSISQAYATGVVSGTGDNVGGLVGFNSSAGSISQAYATGALSGTYSVGGLVGLNNDASIIQAYATGAVTGMGYYVGGLVGFNDILGSITTSYWDSESTLQAQAVGSVNNHAGVSALTSANRYNTASYGHLGTWAETAAGSGVWAASDSAGQQWIMLEGQTRPFLFSEYSTTIGNAHQLQLMAYNLGAHYTLANNIDATATAGSNGSGMWSHAGFSPIGSAGSRFTGSLDGLGHSISGLTIKRENQHFVGLFGYTESSSTLRNIGLLGGSFTGKNNVGGLVGWNAGSILQAYATGAVTGTSVVGGLVGYNTFGSILQAYATGAVSGTTQVGGLVGNNDSSISQAYATGAVTGTNYVGGLVGYNGGTSTNSYWDIESSGQNIGYGRGDGAGIIGLTSSQMKNASSFSAWSSDISSAGGSNAVWRIYEGHTGPLLRSFLKAVTVTLDPASIAGKTYDGTVASGTFTYTPSLADAVLAGSATYISNSANVGTYSTANGSLSVAGLYSGQQGYDISYTPIVASLTITPKALTVTGVTVNSKEYDGSTAATLSGGSLSGLIDNETLELSGLSAVFNDQNAGTGKAVTVSGATLGNGTNGGLASNYTVSNPSGVIANITPKALTITANNATKTYDGLAYNGSSGATYSGWVNGETAAVLTGALSYSSGINAGSHGITLAGVSASNYAISYAPGSLLITPRALTITANNATKTYDGLAYNGSSGATYSGWVNGDTEAVLTGALSYSSGINAGSHSITLAGVSASNYAISYAPGSLLITPRALTITANNLSKAQGQWIELAYSAQGLAQGETLSSVTLSSAGQARQAAVGRYLITASDAQGIDLANYAIRYQSGELQVTPSLTNDPAYIAALVSALQWPGNSPFSQLLPLGSAQAEDEPLMAFNGLPLTLENGGMRLPEGL